MSTSPSQERADLAAGDMPAPVIAAEEYAQRRSALADACAEQDAGGVIVYGDDRRFAGPNHIRYLTGFDPHFEPVFLAMREQSLFLLSGSETKGLATNEQLVRDAIEVSAIRELAYPGLEYTTIELVPGVELLRELFSGLASVALIGAASIGSEDAARIVDPLRADFCLTDLDETAYGLRAVKSESEHR